jgi:hypothetical protein
MSTYHIYTTTTNHHFSKKKEEEKGKDTRTPKHQA